MKSVYTLLGTFEGGKNPKIESKDYLLAQVRSHRTGLVEHLRFNGEAYERHGDEITVSRDEYHDEWYWRQGQENIRLAAHVNAVKPARVAVGRLLLAQRLEEALISAYDLWGNSPEEYAKLRQAVEKAEAALVAVSEEELDAATCGIYAGGSLSLGTVPASLGSIFRHLRQRALGRRLKTVCERKANSAMGWYAGAIDFGHAYITVVGGRGLDDEGEPCDLDVEIFTEESGEISFRTSVRAWELNRFSMYVEQWPRSPSHHWPDGKWTKLAEDVMERLKRAI